MVFKDKKKTKRNSARKEVGREKEGLEEESKGQEERSTQAQAELRICEKEKVTAIKNFPVGKSLP